jgi:hypothetical protein
MVVLMPISLDGIEYTFDPDLEGVPDSDKDAALNDIGEFIIDSILEYVSQSKTPVAGGSFQKKLSSKYAEREGKTNANLDLNGDMLNSLGFEIDGESLKILIKDNDQVPKSYNHNVGDTLPRRQFIPDDDQTFKSDILRGVGRIIQEYLDGN